MRLDNWGFFDSGILVQPMSSDLISGEIILHIPFHFSQIWSSFILSMSFTIKLMLQTPPPLDLPNYLSLVRFVFSSNFIVHRIWKTQTAFMLI